jgi:hypothetical protein
LPANQGIFIMRQMNLFGGSDEIVRSPIEILKSRPAPDPRSPVVVSYGGGRNSTALLILCQKLGIKVDLILFADTGGELPETYKYIDIFSKWLVENKMPEITIIKRLPSSPNPARRAAIYAREVFKICFFKALKANKTEIIFFVAWLCMITSISYENLYEECVFMETLPSVAFGKKQCSQKWKAEPQERYIKAWKKEKGIDKNIPARCLKGIHAKEIYRIISPQGTIKFLDEDGYRNEFPLIEYGIDDYASQLLIQSVGLPVPPKSSCFFCPNRKIQEVADLPEEIKFAGDLLEQVAMDGIFWRGDKSIAKGLGRSFSWRSLGQLTELEKTAIAFRQESRSCHCID